MGRDEVPEAGMQRDSDRNARKEPCSLVHFVGSCLVKLGENRDPGVESKSFPKSGVSRRQIEPPLFTIRLRVSRMGDSPRGNGSLRRARMFIDAGATNLQVKVPMTVCSDLSAQEMPPHCHTARRGWTHS